LKIFLCDHKCFVFKLAFSSDLFVFEQKMTFDLEHLDHLRLKLKADDAFSYVC